MELEEFKKLKGDELVINIKENEFGTPYVATGDYQYVLKVNESKTMMYNSCKDLYTKEQLKEIKVSSLQAVNLLQNDDFFEIGDSFEGLNGDKIIKQKDGIQIILNQKYDDVLLSSNSKDMIFKPYTKPFTKQDLKSGMIVINSDNGIGHIILNSIKGDIIQYNCGRIDNLSDYNDNLVKNCNDTKINKIYKLKDNYSFNNYDFNDKLRYELLWSRE